MSSCLSGHAPSIVHSTFQDGRFGCLLQNLGKTTEVIPGLVITFYSIQASLGSRSQQLRKVCTRDNLDGLPSRLDQITLFLSRPHTAGTAPNCRITAEIRHKGVSCTYKLANRSGLQDNRTSVHRHAASTGNCTLDR